MSNNETKWIYLENEEIQSSERLNISKELEGATFLKPGTPIDWGFDERFGYFVLDSSNEDLEEGYKAEIFTQFDSYSVQSGGTIAIPRKIEEKKEDAVEKHGELGFYHGELRHFLKPLKHESDPIVYILSMEQLESSVQSPDNWVDSSVNRRRLRENNNRIPDSILPSDFRTGDDVDVEEDERVLDKVESSPGIQVLPDHDSVNDRVLDDIADIRPDSIHVLQYSSQKVWEIVRRALGSGITVYLLVRHPDPETKWNVARSQSEQIKNQVQSVIDEVIDVKTDPSLEDPELHLQFYFHQAGLRALRLEDGPVYAGWYTYENRDSMERDKYRKHVQGHNNPVMAIPREVMGFEAMNEMFEKSFYSLWKQGTSMQNILKTYYWEGLDDWLELKKKRRQVVEEVSGLDADELFEEKDWMEKIEEVEDGAFYDNTEYTR